MAAPLVSPAAPSLRSSTPTVDAIAFDRRLVHDSQVAQRAQLLTAAAVVVRQRALTEQQHARSKEQHQLEERATAEAQRRAERTKKLAERTKKLAEEASIRAAQAKRAEQRAQQREAQRATQDVAAKPRHITADASGSPRAIARSLMGSKYGWGSAEFSCYNNIIMRESGWRVHADNPSSSAYGIPQALPGSKMASAGPDWRNNPATQITWGLGYVKSRYGTPCGAWSFKRSHGWY